MAFDIVTYLGSILGYPIPKETVQRIAMERGLNSVADWTEIKRRDRNLAIADMVMYIFTSPNDTGNKSKSHGDFSISIGSIKIYDKNDLYQLMMKIYQNPDAELWESMSEIGNCSWLDVL